MYSGRRFRRHMIGRIAGFAERAGGLELAGGQAVVQVLQGDMFFGGVKEKTLYANPIQALQGSGVAAGRSSGSRRPVSGTARLHPRPSQPR